MTEARKNPVAHEVHELVLHRWSPVSFDSAPLEASTVARLVEAARWAPSCFNAQPWRFVLGRKGAGDSHARLASCLVDANREWAEHAPLLVLVIARRNFEHNEKPNRWAWYDCGQAASQMQTQAIAMGLHAHSMAGYDADKARETFHIPEGYDPVCVIAFGRIAADASHLSADTAARDRGARKRKPLGESVFEGRFGETSEVVG